MMDNPILLLFDPSPVSASQDLPISVYESALESTGENIRLVELGYGIETGEAERIAVDGVSRGGMGDGGVESSGESGLLVETDGQSHWEFDDTEECYPHAL